MPPFFRIPYIYQSGSQWLPSYEEEPRPSALPAFREQRYVTTCLPPER